MMGSRTGRRIVTAIAVALVAGAPQILAPTAAAARWSRRPSAHLGRCSSPTRSRSHSDCRRAAPRTGSRT
ncbi:hypothetical protein GS881_14920 [Rhodococcus hoagii]|nr:hypothetical protein [Prescottella equi]